MEFVILPGQSAADVMAELRRMAERLQDGQMLVIKVSTRNARHSREQRKAFAELFAFARIARLHTGSVAKRLGLSQIFLDHLVHGRTEHAVLTHAICNKLPEVLGVPRDHPEILRLHALALQDG